MNKNKGCKGCNQIEICKLSSSYMFQDKLNTCPCQTCLIKSMCSKECELYSIYIHQFYHKENSNQDVLISKYNLDKNYSSALQAIYKFNHYQRGIPIMIKFDNKDKLWTFLPCNTVYNELFKSTEQNYE